MMEQIFTVRQLFEKVQEFKRPVHIVFVDIKDLFDSVGRALLWLTLKLLDKLCRTFCPAAPQAVFL